MPEMDGPALSLPIEAVARNWKLSETVAKRIVDEIAEQQLAPGSRLPPERVMLERFGVSRGTLREALRILEVHGFLVIRSGPRGGPVVASMTPADFNKACSLHFKAAGITVQQLWEARVSLEPMLARLAAANLTPSGRESLEEVLQAADASLVEDRANYIRLGSEIHRRIAEASGSPILSLFARSLGEMTAHLESGAVFPAADHQRVHEEHMAIIRAILGRKVTRAERLVAAHMQDILETHAKRYPGSLDQVLPYVI